MKRKIRAILRKYGFDIIKFKKNQMGLYPFYDMAKFVKTDKPILFDVGANVGQTIKDFKEVFNNSTVHAFEPSPDTFNILKTNTTHFKDVVYWNYGVGSTSGDLLLNEYNHSNTNSFLDIHNYENKNLKSTSQVKVITIDQFIRDNDIKKIDVLKIDTEGFELEVFKGAETSLKSGKIDLLFFEVNFIETHKDSPKMSQLWDFITEIGFKLVSIYPVVHKKNMAVYTNVLFKYKN